MQEEVQREKEQMHICVVHHQKDRQMWATHGGKEQFEESLLSKPTAKQRPAYTIDWEDFQARDRHLGHGALLDEHELAALLLWDTMDVDNSDLVDFYVARDTDDLR